jgi:hypothetical protein
LKRLEPDEGKLSSPVLRGGSGGNVVSLPDYVVKGDTFKGKAVKTTFEEAESGHFIEIRTATDAFKPVIRALDFTPSSETFGQALVIR